MGKSAKKERFYSIVIIPHDAMGHPISLKLPIRWLYGALIGVVFGLVLVGSSVVYSAIISRRLIDYSNTLSKNREQHEVISAFALKTGQVIDAVKALEEEDNQLRKLLGLKSWKNKINLSGHTSQESDTVKLSIAVERAKDQLTERKQSFDQLKEWVSYVRSKFASTPSIWPIYGRIASSFGYRSYPWRGFHYGIDIKGNYGAPVRVTAAGVVSYVGWRRGYGKTVEIDHGNGTKTLYAHSSKYAVKVGERVKKGQIVCYVGMTGWTTGPHLHYEVRRWGTPLNPLAFLEQNVLSASKLWR